MTEQAKETVPEKPAASVPLKEPVVDPHLVVQGKRGVDPALIAYLTAAEPFDRAATRLVESNAPQPSEKESSG
jgi:hypothetical protein